MKTVKETAAMLGYDESHIRRLCLEGKLEAKKFGWMWMVSAESIKAWRKRLRRTKTAEKADVQRHLGSDFDTFLEEEGVLDEVTKAVDKRLKRMGKI